VSKLPDEIMVDSDRPVSQQRASPYPVMIAAAALVVIMVCAAGYTVWDLHERAMRETRASLAKLAMVIAEQTSRSFQQVDLALAEIAGHIAQPGAVTASINAESFHNYLADRMRGLPQIGNLVIADENGRMLNHALSLPVPDVDISSREQFCYLRDNADAGLFVSEPVSNKLSGAWTLYLARRLNGPRGEFRGIVQAAVRLADFEEFYQTVALGAGSSIQLLRQDGMRLARYPRSAHIGSPVKNRDELQRGGEFLEIDPDGVALYIAMHTVRGFPLAVAAAMTKEAMLGSWRRDAAVMLLGASAAIAGVLVLLLAMARRIRLLRDSEQLLARQNESLANTRQLLLEAQRIGKLGYWLTDAAGENASWSPQLFEIAGLPPATNVNLGTARSLLYPEDADDYLRQRVQVGSSQASLIQEHRWIRPDGGLIWVRVEANPRLGPDGEVIGLFGIVQDITERKAAEARLLESQRMLSDAIESISQGFVLYDRDDRFVLANSKLRQMFPALHDLLQPGVSFSDTLREWCKRAGTATDTDRFADWYARTMASHRAAGEPRNRRLPNGRWLQFSDHRTSEGGIAGLVTDITDFKAVEAALEQEVADLERARNDLESQKRALVESTAELTRARDAAEAANRAKSDFLAIMSHEIRTPMTGMIGMINLLAEMPLGEEQQRYANLALEAADGLLDVINDILDFSKLEAGRFEPEAIDFDVARLLSGILDSSRKKAVEQGLEFSLSLGHGMPGWLKGDPTRIRQVLLNLINNAIKFTSRGYVQVAASHRVLADDTIELRIEVADSGIGIPPDVKDRLFNAFIQADTSVSRKYGGSGLGLAICDKLCRMMGGTIGLDSTHHQGSTFWFTVMCHPTMPEVAAPALHPSDTEAGRPLHILVAEDSPIVATLIASLLQKKGHRADMVVNGADAVKTVQNAAYDLVLMDVQMPEMDGISAAKAIRGLAGAERAIPIIALTANAVVGQREQYLQAGMNDYVTKPIRPAALFAAIDRWRSRDGVLQAVDTCEWTP